MQAQSSEKQKIYDINHLTNLTFTTTYTEPTSKKDKQRGKVYSKKRATSYAQHLSKEDVENNTERRKNRPVQTISAKDEFKHLVKKELSLIKLKAKQLHNIKIEQSRIQ